MLKVKNKGPERYHERRRSVIIVNFEQVPRTTSVFPLLGLNK